MAQFDVYAMKRGRGFLLDCQTDFVAGLETRLVAPLLLWEDYSSPAKRLNPVFDIAGGRVVMMTQYLGAIERRELGANVANLASEHLAITSAIDMLLTGF